MVFEFFNGKNERALHQKRTLREGRVLYDEEPLEHISVETGVPMKDPSTFNPNLISLKGKGKSPSKIDTDPIADELLKQSGYDKYGNKI